MARLLEGCLAVGLIVAPFPFGAVREPGRSALELGALVLLLLWIARSLFRDTPLPSLAVRVGLIGLLALAVVQALPLGDGMVGRLSPAAVTLRAESLPPQDVQESEQRLLGRDPLELDPPAALSLDPGATASAVRTGAAMLTAFLVALTVAATCGARRIALALLFGAAFQGLYGLLVMASGHDRIWLVEKKYFLDVATGTFVNPNHFGCLMAISLPCGLALIYDNARRGHMAATNGRLSAWLSVDGFRNWLLGLLLIVAGAGLLLSYSRAGIAFGLLVLALTMLAAGRKKGLRVRLIIALLVVAVAVTPLMQIGVERLIDDYARSPSELHGARVRVWLDSFGLVAAYPLTGCGFGAFSASYPLVRAPEIRSFFAHTHNDPLQLLAEGGLTGFVLLLLVLIPLLRHLVSALGGNKGTLAVGFAAGLVAVMLHAMVDFNFHIPSNAVISAVLAGTLMGLPCKRAN